ncbi:glutamine amidotransferase [Oscillatoria sp. FACHB-1406]|uniref:glutamine amidotransferase-related protein n=1 Tax=Oscillatoria sp. FACHB-1406 TaxID=2692846 RepID=UPI00168752A5|nr:glutamine amidotransferase [Oscillatoria sp. FACHB-1406]MBD2577703.1 glutamine amidotransferase [Oscillatoria sp. FACHB-1406]
MSVLPSRKILAVVHQAISETGEIGNALCALGYRAELCCPAMGAELPSGLEAYAGAVIFGGPMSANDDHLPFIRRELDWIETVLSSGLPFLGICLGAQMLARVLGANVAAHPEGINEIGYFPVQFLDRFAIATEIRPPQYVYHWHQEGFELPAGTEKLAQGETFVNQAFRYGDRNYGLQFHPEITSSMLERWTQLGAAHLSRPGAQSPEEQKQKHALYSEEVRYWLPTFLNAWLELR